MGLCFPLVLSTTACKNVIFWIIFIIYGHLYSGQAKWRGEGGGNQFSICSSSWKSCTELSSHAWNLSVLQLTEHEVVRCPSIRSWVTVIYFWITFTTQLYCSQVVLYTTTTKDIKGLFCIYQGHKNITGGLRKMI